MSTSTVMLKYWWQKHAEEIKDDDLYSSFEKAWEAAQHYLLLSMNEWTPGQIGKAIAEARLEEAVEEKDLQHIETCLSFLDYEKKILERARQRIEDAAS